MNAKRRRLLVALALAPVARSYPVVAAVSPVRLVVPGDPGGVLDIRARWLAPKLEGALGRPVRVENIAGAGGLIGMRAARAGPRDGSLLVMVHQGTMAVQPHLHEAPGFDPLQDFLPLTRMGHGPLVIAVPQSSRHASLGDLLASGRQAPLSFSSPGLGTPPHLAGRLLMQAAGMQGLHVPFKGGGQALSALLGSQVDFAAEGPTVLKPQTESRRLRALAHTGRGRAPGWPDLSAVADHVANFQYQAWTGLAVPAGTPAGVVETLHAAVLGVLRTEAAEQWFEARGANVGSGSPAEFAALIREEHSLWQRRVVELSLRSEAQG